MPAGIKALFLLLCNPPSFIIIYSRDAPMTIRFDFGVGRLMGVDFFSRMNIEP